MSDHDANAMNSEQPVSDIALRKRHQEIQATVDEQAEDDGLWFVAQTAPEAYLQQELRRLHAVIEGSA